MKFILLFIAMTLVSYEDKPVETQNGTRLIGVEEMVMYAADKLGIKNVKIFINPMPAAYARRGTTTFSAFAKQGAVKGWWNLYVDTNVDPDILEDVITHEMIHVWQTEEGMLEIKNDNEAIYRNQMYETTNEKDYYSLPWEAEAKQLSFKILMEKKRAEKKAAKAK